MRATLLGGMCLWLAASVAGQQPATPPAKASAKTMSSSLGVYVFPTQGQSPEAQQQNEAACYAWAQSNTGFDPLAAASASASRQAGQPSQKGGLLKSAGSGAAMGAAIGAISGDAGQGAATGATAGAVRGKLAQKRAQRKAQQAQAEAQEQQAAAWQAFRKAFGACMEGKGYAAK